MEIYAFVTAKGVNPFIPKPSRGGIGKARRSTATNQGPSPHSERISVAIQTLTRSLFSTAQDLLQHSIDPLPPTPCFDGLDEEEAVVAEYGIRAEYLQKEKEQRGRIDEAVRTTTRDVGACVEEICHERTKDVRSEVEGFRKALKKLVEAQEEIKKDLVLKLTSWGVWDWMEVRREGGKWEMAEQKDEILRRVEKLEGGRERDRDELRELKELWSKLEAVQDMRAGVKDESASKFPAHPSTSLAPPFAFQNDPIRSSSTLAKPRDVSTSIHTPSKADEAPTARLETLAASNETLNSRLETAFAEIADLRSQVAALAAEKEVERGQGPRYETRSRDVGERKWRDELEVFKRATEERLDANDEVAEFVLRALPALLRAAKVALVAKDRGGGLAKQSEREDEDSGSLEDGEIAEAELSEEL
ncbi:hypothetical protein MNV49_001696 [Pseudohyphozyma bogoriensis]|nr:hypothetical protein MNV49_001696 [Pseudohyphozyma bogoriensis]